MVGKNSRKLASFITILMIVFSVFLGAKLSFARLRSSAETAFFKSDNASYSVDESLETFGDEALKLAKMAENYTLSDDDVKTRIARYAEIVMDGDNIIERGNAYEKLLPEITKASNELASLVSENDRRSLSAISAELHSASMLISFSDYVEIAQEYNNALSKFPAKILAFITRDKKLQTFEVFHG